jgi:hypothetical protein
LILQTPGGVLQVFCRIDHARKKHARVSAGTL